MESVITGLVSRFGYWGVLLLIAVENIFPPIPSEVILTFGGFLTTCTEMTPPGVILFSTLGSVAGAIVLYGVGRLLAPQRLEALLSGRVGRVLKMESADVPRRRTGLRPTAGPVCFTAAASPSCAASSPSRRAWRACIRRRFCCSPPWAACCGISCWSIWARWPGKAGLPLRPRWNRPRAG